MIIWWGIEPGTKTIADVDIVADKKQKRLDMMF